jgi:hypothetical protein
MSSSCNDKYEQDDVSKSDLPKRRGRKKKQKEEFIEAEEYVYNGTTYLVDSKNVVYTNNIDAPTVVGERLIDGSLKFYNKS